MAASVEKWFCDELSKFGLEVNEENAQCILAMEDAEELQEYMLNLLDGTDPKVQTFIPRLIDRWCSLGRRAPPNITVYKKDKEEAYVQPKATGRKKRGKNKAGVSSTNSILNTTSNPITATSTTPTTNNNAFSQAASSFLGIGAEVSPSLNGASSVLHSDEQPAVMMNGGDTASSFPSSALSSESEPHLLQNGEVKVAEVSEMKAASSQQSGARKKSKFVPLYSHKGKEKLVITLPGRTQCECQALKHTLINNCMSCGRVVCKQEGAGPCLFCGQLVCTPEDQEVLNRGSKKSEKMRQYLMRDADKFTPLCRGGGMSTGEEGRQALPSVSSRMQEGLDKAIKHKERLLEYDKTSVRRTQVIDDECDYFATDSNQWLNQNEREALRKREEELRSLRFASRKDRKITLDFAGRQVVEEDGGAVGRSMYNHKDSVVQDVQYGKKRPEQQARGGAGASQEEGGGGYLVNPTIVQPAPQFIPSGGKTSSSKGGKSKSGQRAKAPSDNFGSKSKVMGVIQDRELREMRDEGVCLSMHQPWASLLVAGIKMHEGRSWYTAHRGRLWIASTAKAPSSEEISEMEHHYQLQYDEEVEFPEDYPAGCLLGCVDMVDCLSQEDYRQKYPEGESACPYVFICENPQQLLIKFPMKGKHKIYKLDAAVHQAARKGLR